MSSATALPALTRPAHESNSKSILLKDAASAAFRVSMGHAMYCLEVAADYRGRAAAEMLSTGGHAVELRDLQLRRAGAWDDLAARLSNVARGSLQRVYLRDAELVRGWRSSILAACYGERAALMRAEADRFHDLIAAACRGEVVGVGGVPQWARLDDGMRSAPYA